MLSDRLGYEFLIAAASIAVGGVEKIDPDLAGPPDRRDSRGAVGLAVEWGHRAAAETNGRDLQLPKCATLHAVPPSKSVTVTGLIFLNRVSTSFAKSRICPFSTPHRHKIRVDLSAGPASETVPGSGRSKEPGV